jgi:hypothetical protein
MRHLFIATVTTAVLLATGAFPDRAEAADVGPPYGPPPGHGPQPGYGSRDDYGPPPAYGQPPAYGPSRRYDPRDDYGPPPAYGPPPSPRYSSRDDYGPPPAYGSPRRYDPPDDYGPPSDYGPPPRPPHAIPYAVSPVRPVCDVRWRCVEGFAGPGACGWRRVCYRRSAAEVYARPYGGYADRGYGLPPGPRYYGPY